MTVRNAPINSVTDYSGTITVGGTSQRLVAANPLRRRLTIHNPSTAALQGIGSVESIFISYTGAANVTGGAGSIEIFPGGTWDDGFDAPYGTVVNINAATTAHKFTCTEGV